MSTKGDPSFIKPKLRRSVALQLMGEIKKAEDAFRLVVSEDKSSLEAQQGLAQCQQKIREANAERLKGNARHVASLDKYFFAHN